MDEFDFAEVWKQLLPANVQVAAGPIMKEPPPLTSNELASAGSVSPTRLRELQCGRYYAKQALLKLGVEHVELLVAKNRAPAWPNGPPPCTVICASYLSVRPVTIKGWVAVTRNDSSGK